MIKFVFLSFTALLLLSLADESFAKSRLHNKDHSHKHGEHEHSHDEHCDKHEDDCDGDCKHNHGKRHRH
jgi:hypothetical protein